MSRISTKFKDCLHGTRLAYRLREGKPVTVVFCGGYMSDMTGTKATFLDGFCREKGWGYLRFDYAAHGKSGGKFRECTIGQWVKDTLCAIEEVKGDLIIVGSSLGGWIALLAALELKSRLKGIALLAPAPDFTERLIWKNLTSEQKKTLEEKGEIREPSDYGDEPYIFTRKLIEEGREHLLLDKPIDLDLPVRIIHGMKDTDVPYEISLDIMKCLTSSDASLELLGNVDHRLSAPDELDRLASALKSIVPPESGGQEQS